MDFDLTEEQRLLKESLDRLIGDRYTFEQRKSYAQAPAGWSRKLWAQYAGLGLLGLPFAEQYGGSAGGPVETMIAMEAFGGAVVLEPFLATVVLGGGGRRDRDGVGVFIVDGKAAGVSRRGYPTQDGLHAAEITLAGVRVGPEGVLGEPGAALPLVERVVDEAVAALCAEAVGAMAAMHELTVEYLKTRRQFGREIGSFQVLQHRAVDMLIALEQARSMAMFATMMAADENALERRNAVAAAKVQIGRSGKFIGQKAIQLHGGIGMTMEYKVGHYFKRVTMIDTMFGDADHHLATLARMGGIVGKT